MILALLLCLQDTVEMKDFKSSYTVVKPADYSDKSSWPAVVDLGNPKDPSREPRMFVLKPGSREDETFVLACLTDLKTRYRINPERVVIRGGSAALGLAVGHPELFAACAIRRPRAFTPPKKAPPCTVFLAAADPDRVAVLAAAMTMKKAGINVQVREATAEPDEIASVVVSRLPPGGNALTALEMVNQRRWLDASLLCFDLLDKEDKPARTLLKSIEGNAIIELAKVELAISERRYKDGILRCREAARQFAWVPTGEKIRKRLGELESRPEVMKSLQTDD
jgi:hypothetical protein